MKLFQKPRKYELMRGFITEYKVNGIDSLALLDVYFRIYPQYTISLATTEFFEESEISSNIVFSPNFGTIKYQWNNDYNNLIIIHENDTGLIKKNIFIESGANWQILKLIPKKKTTDHLLKIKSEFKGNVYEIQFN
jgi:hypothetical protein